MPPIKAKAGRYRQLIEIQRNTPTTNSSNERIDSFATVCNWYAEIRPVTGREPWQARQPVPDVTHEIEMRAFIDTAVSPSKRLNPTYRIKYGARLFNIVDVLNQGEQYQQTPIIVLAMERP
jgi:head-tail adaptor